MDKVNTMDKRGGSKLTVANSQQNRESFYGCADLFYVIL